MKVTLENKIKDLQKKIDGGKIKVKQTKDVEKVNHDDEAIMLCVGPSTAEKIDKVTGHLKLY